jgi:hypothetical protein
MVKRPAIRAAHVAQVADTLARGEALSKIGSRDDRDPAVSPKA